MHSILEKALACAALLAVLAPLAAYAFLSSVRRSSLFERIAKDRTPWDAVLFTVLPARALPPHKGSHSRAGRGAPRSSASSGTALG